jgi:hypothetical protein
VPAGWERAITVSMEAASLTAEFGQQQLATRLAELEPATRPADLSALRDVFGLIPGSRIDITVFASDPSAEHTASAAHPSSRRPSNDPAGLTR